LGKQRGDRREDDDLDGDGREHPVHRPPPPTPTRARPGPLVCATVLTPFTLSITFRTDGSIGRRKTFGHTPMKMHIAIVGTIMAHSRPVRSGSARFFSFVTGP